MKYSQNHSHIQNNQYSSGKKKLILRKKWNVCNDIPYHHLRSPLRTNEWTWSYQDTACKWPVLPSETEVNDMLQGIYLVNKTQNTTPSTRTERA